ncbi:MAG: DNA/RNA non-specific endonuclease [bacterium]
MRVFLLFAGSLLWLLTSEGGEGSPIHPWGAPKAIGSDVRLKVLRYQGFECGYLPRVKLSLWVAYRYFHAANLRRRRYQGRFMPDTFRLKKSEAAFPQVYDSVPGFVRFVIDKGHMAPDAAIKVFGAKAQSETYFLTNIIPQFGNTNRFIWAGLEKTIRRWGARDTVWVIVGPLFYPGMDTFWLGRRNIAIPHACYCVVARKRALAMIGFIVPNDSIRRYGRDLPRFIVSVDSIEKLTGFDFFPDLPRESEQKLEAERGFGL